MLKDFENESSRLNPLFHKLGECQRDNRYCISKSDQLVPCSRKFMVLNLLEGIETTSVLRQRWSILKDTNSIASLHALALIPDSTDLCPGLLLRLHIHH